MGRDKTSSQQTTTVQATPEEQEFNKIQLAQIREADPFTRELQKTSLQTANQLGQGVLTGETTSPIIDRLLSGIDPEVTQSIVDKSLKDVATSAQFSGILDSGTAAQLATNTSADIRNQSEQFNLGGMFNLLNLMGGQAAQVQAPGLQTASTLGGQLAGLRTTNTSGTQTAMNPFLKSFQTSLGGSLGGGTFGNTKGIFS